MEFCSGTCTVQTLLLSRCFPLTNDFFTVFPKSDRASPSNSPNVGILLGLSRGLVTMFILHCKKHLQSVIQIYICCLYSQESGKFWEHASLFISFRMASSRWRQPATQQQTVVGQQEVLPSPARASEAGPRDPFMKGVSLPSRTRLETMSGPELIHKQIRCHCLRGDNSKRGGKYTAGEAVCVRAGGWGSPDQF